MAQRFQRGLNWPGGPRLRFAAQLVRGFLDWQSAPRWTERRPGQPSLEAGHVTDAERGALEALAAIKGGSCPQIRARLGVHRTTVRKWWHRYAEQRLKGLRDEPRPGAPRTVTAQDWAAHRRQQATLPMQLIATVAPLVRKAVAETGQHPTDAALALTLAISAERVRQHRRLLGV